MVKNAVRSAYPFGPSHLVHKGLVQEVGPPDAQVDDVHLDHQRIVERIEEPGGEGDLQGGGEEEGGGRR